MIIIIGGIFIGVDLICYGYCTIVHSETPTFWEAFPGGGISMAFKHWKNS